MERPYLYFCPHTFEQGEGRMALNRDLPPEKQTFTMRILVEDDGRPWDAKRTLILQSAGLRNKSCLRRGAKIKLFCPEVVISDVIVPGINGIEDCGRVRPEQPNCHI